MPDEIIKPAIRAALRMHEIGNSTPYQLSFASKGKSGASFGFMQGDLGAQQRDVTEAFNEILTAAGFEPSRIRNITRKLAGRLITNPLSKTDTDDVDRALRAHPDIVDQMDERILAGVYTGLDASIAAAQGAGRSIEPKAQIYIALWINMSGAPTKLLTWLKGGEPHLSRPVPAAAALVTAAQMESYLRATNYYVCNPGNFPHLLRSVDAGAALLPGAVEAVLPMAAAAGPAVAGLVASRYLLPGDVTNHLVYEQATGRLLVYENGTYDTLAVGYSGSLSRHAQNDPDQQCVKGSGPIPRGGYAIGSPRPGPSPYSLPLTPDPANDMCGRSGFLIHGDSVSHPGDASDGCIILTRTERQAVVATGLKTLVVVARISA